MPDVKMKYLLSRPAPFGAVPRLAWFPDHWEVTLGHSRLSFVAQSLLDERAISLTGRWHQPLSVARFLEYAYRAGLSFGGLSLHVSGDGSFAVGIATIGSMLVKGMGPMAESCYRGEWGPLLDFVEERGPSRLAEAVGLMRAEGVAACRT